MRLGLGGIVSLAVLLAAAPAGAAQRYAAPAGFGTACTQADPCSLKESVGKANTGDEVVVTPGSYGLEQGVFPKPGVKGVDIHGVTGQPPPKIMGAVNSGLLSTSEGSLRYLDVVNTGSEYPSAVSCGAGGRIEQVRASATGANAVAIYQSADCLVRDSVAVAGGSQSSGLASSSWEGYKATASNLTAIATGPGSTGVNASTVIIAGAQSHALDLQNTIASGEAADLRAAANATYDVAVKIDVSNSNFDTVDVEPKAAIGGSGNQTAAPVFVDAAAGNYHEAPGSPTIDAGSSAGIGALDPDGNARLLGSAPDIGAFEFVPPVPPPVPLGEIQSLTIAPKSFRAANAGGAILSARKGKAPIGATVSYALTESTSVQFSIERKLSGRRSGKKCVKATRANEGRKKCPLYEPVKGGFSHAGVAGLNAFRFSGRRRTTVLTPRDRALGAGSYRLTGNTSTASKSADFKIVK
jgi:hypothetical protein